MSTLLDIILATFLGGIIILITLNANMTLKESWASYNHQLIVQEMLVTTAQVLECDLRNMGCGMANTTQTVVEADTSRIIFQMAPNADYITTPQPVLYYTGGLGEAEAGETDNPNDRILWRRVGGTSSRVGLVTEFYLKYMDEWGETINSPVNDPNERARIRIIEITMEVQSPYPTILEPAERYASALWKQTRLASRNFLR
ncbi:MAG: hypothetical protein JXA06_08000 [Bacteroidetes bacterium]|nr:hypothetical protein [Bacteroidota bacterium]